MREGRDGVGQRRINWWTVWSVLLRLCGLAIVLRKAFSADPTADPILYLVACSMMGVSLTLPADRRRKGDDE